MLRLRHSEAQALALTLRNAGAGTAAAANPAHWTAALELPLSTEPRRCHNVIARLPGRGHGAALLLCAHFDHVGDDPGGARFPGAFDNASGVALLLALARTLAHERRQLAAPELPFDIVFAALTGEESGLWGAQQLRQQPPGPIGAVVNLDSFGLRGAPLAVRTGHARRGDRFAEWAAERLQRRGLQVQWVDGRDDSAVFRQAGWPTLGLGQQPLEPGTNPMHTPDDTPDRLDPDVLQRMHDAVLDLIHEFAAFAAMPPPQGETP
ncbi:MAG: M28 family metallopeptidase [Aquabacterium sp.]|nr:M28 family metallopeptidase [Aquabacterium sp.]